MTYFMTTIAPEIIYTLCGLVSLDAAWRGLKNDKARIGTALFWAILGVIFIFGKWMPYALTGALLCVMGILTVTKQVQMGRFVESTKEEREIANANIKSKIFIPAITVGLMAVALSFVKIDGQSMNGAVMIGIACLVALALAILICKPKLNETRENTSRLLMQVGASCLLPQLLGALGTLFTQAGVGEVISGMISNVVPAGNIVVGVLLYCAGMVIFTMIMGNGFAAFSVITVGIGIPFVILQGGDPTIVGALGMTCGFCGTLLTPMAANFNIVPCAVLETNNKWTVIKTQMPMSFALIIVHVILMLILAF